MVLAADRTLIAAYDVLLDGMMAASQTTGTPWPIMNRLLMPPAPHPGGRALFAPLGLRRIEAALLESGLSRDEVAVVDEAHLAAVVGPATRVVAVTSGEPTGVGMSSTTMTAVVGGEIYPQVMFRRLLARVRELRASRAPEAKVVLGGPGAWQVAQQGQTLRELGVDHLVVGYAEGNASALLRGLLEGRQTPAVVEGVGVPAAAIPRIRGASTMGVVEVSRGCGLGCGFCTIARVPMEHLPVDTILADVETNLAAGLKAAAILSEDFLRYGATGVGCRPEAALGLLERLRQVERLRLVQLDHVNLASIAQYDDAELKALRELLTAHRPKRRPWVNVGVETASGGLLAANGGGPKMGGVDPPRWGEFAAEQLRRLCRAGFTPMASLVVGLPGETPAEVGETLEWVRSMREEPLTIFPVLYAPVRGEAPVRPEGLTRLQWQLIRECYELNFRGVPVMYWDDQSAAQVGLGKRLALQGLGKGQVVQWRWLLARHARRAAA